MWERGRIGTVYFGEYTTRLDDKGRITIPSPYRKIMDVMKHSVWYMTRGFDKSIFLFHHDEWNKIRAQVGKFSAMNAKALDFRRLLFGSVAEVKHDPQGRMAVPPHLREHAGLNGEAVLIGVDDHIELWDKNAWRAFQNSNEAEFKEMASVLFMGEEHHGASAT